MAVHNTQSNNVTNYTLAVLYRNPTHRATLDWAQPGQADPDASGLTAIWDPDNPPFALGSGVYVSTGGRFLMGPEQEPVHKFVVINDSAVDVYANVNAVQSGTWSIADGITIASGASYEFGGLGADIIRNIWAISSSGDAVVQGGAVNMPGWL